MYQHLVMAHAALITAPSPAPTPDGGAVVGGEINKAGLYTIVGIAVSVLFVIAGVSIMTRHKKLTIGQAGSESGVIGIGATLIAVGLLGGTIILGIVSGVIGLAID